MPLSKEQLLIPRVICIGTETGTNNDTLHNYISGDIIEFTNIGVQEYPVWVCDKFGYALYLYESFPHLFKPLPWWYGRAVEEMPEYVWLKGKSVCKVDFWDFKYEEAMIFRGNIITTVSIDLLTPADLSDWEEYQKQKEA